MSRQTELEKINAVNFDVNERIQYEKDTVKDYWQCPSETWSLMTGDCDDKAIAKYYALKPTFGDDRLHLAFVRTHGGGGHLVLLVRLDLFKRKSWWKVWEKKTWRPCVAVLDNLSNTVYDLDSETRYEVEYVINESGYTVSGKTYPTCNHPKWAAMVARRNAQDIALIDATPLPQI
jgi:hypothetical protein